MDSKATNHRNTDDSHSNRGRTFRGSPRNSTTATSESSIPNQKAVNAYWVNDTATSARNFNKSSERNKTNHTSELEGEPEDTSWAISNTQRRRGQNREFKQDHRHSEFTEQVVSRPPHASGTPHTRSRPPRGGFGRGISRGRYDKRHFSDFNSRRERDSNFNKTDTQSTAGRKCGAAPCVAGNERDSAWNEKVKNEKDAASSKSLENDDLKGITPESKEQEDEMLQLAMQLSLQENQNKNSDVPISERFDPRKIPDTPPLKLHFEESEKGSPVLLKPMEFPPLPSSNVDTAAPGTLRASPSLPVSQSVTPPQIPVNTQRLVSNNPTLTVVQKIPAVDIKGIENWDRLGARPKIPPLVTSHGVGRGSGGGRGRPTLPGSEGDNSPKVGDWVNACVKVKMSETPLEMSSSEALLSKSYLESVGFSSEARNGKPVISVPHALSESNPALPHTNPIHTQDQLKTSSSNLIVLSRNDCSASIESESHSQATESIASDGQLTVKYTVALSSTVVQQTNVVTNAVDSHPCSSNCDVSAVTPQVEPSILPCNNSDIFPVLDEIPICRSEQSVVGDSLDKLPDAGVLTSDSGIHDTHVPEEITVIESQPSSVVSEVQWIEQPKDEKDEIIAQLCRKIEMLQQHGPSGNSVASSMQAPYPAYPIPLPFYTIPVAVPFPLLPSSNPHITSSSMHDPPYQQLPMVPISAAEIPKSSPDLGNADVVVQHAGSCLSPMAEEFVPQDHSTLNVDYKSSDSVECYESRGGRSRGFRVASRPLRKCHSLGYRQQMQLHHYGVGATPWMMPPSGFDHMYTNFVQQGFPPNYYASPRYRPNFISRGINRNGTYPGNNHYGYQ